jgi:hypothetical protein
MALVSTDGLPRPLARRRSPPTLFSGGAGSRSEPRSAGPLADALYGPRSVRFRGSSRVLSSRCPRFPQPVPSPRLHRGCPDRRATVNGASHSVTGRALPVPRPGHPRRMKPTKVQSSISDPALTRANRAGLGPGVVVRRQRGSRHEPHRSMSRPAIDAVRYCRILRQCLLEIEDQKSITFSARIRSLTTAVHSGGVPGPVHGGGRNP